MAIEGLSFIDALYFTVVTVATVGYGDIHPTTAAGKLLAIVVIVTGVGTFLGVFANATELLLVRREERLRLERVSMVVGLFMSEMGVQMMRLIRGADPDAGELEAELKVNAKWTDSRFDEVCHRLGSHRYALDSSAIPFDRIRDFLRENSNLLLRLLENPNLQAQEAFTDLLRAVFHLREELLSRPDFTGLPDSDREHLALDVKRVYGLLVGQWVRYLGYLRERYPYLLSLALRTNPFDRDASVIVR